MLKNNNIVKYYYNFKYLFSMWIYFQIEFIFVMQSWIFSIITQSLVSHDPSEIILMCFDAKETFIIIFNI